MTQPSQVQEAVEGGASARVDRLALLVLACAGLLGVLLLVPPWYDATTDGSVYLLTARALARGEGYTFLGQPFTLRPPGFSLLLAPFARGAETDFATVNRLVAATGVLAALLFQRFFRQRLGSLPAAAAALLLLALPGFERLSSQVMTDVPGAALLVALLLFERRLSRSPSLAGEAALGFSIGAAAWIRSALVLLVPAILLARVMTTSSWRARPLAFLLRRLAPLALCAWVAFLPWSLFQRAHAPEVPVDQTAQHSLATLLLHRDPGDPRSPRVAWSEILTRPARGAREALGALGSMRLTRPEGRAVHRDLTWRHDALGAALLLAFLIALARHRAAGELYAVLFSATVMVFPTHFIDRYTLPLFLFALPAAVELARSAARRLAPAGWADPLVAGVLLALAAAAFRPRAQWDLVRTGNERLTRACEEVRAHTAPSDRLAAAVGWHLALFLDRPVHSLRFAFQRGGAAGVEAALDRYGLNTIVLLDGDRPARRLAPYLDARYRAVLRDDLEGERLTLYRVRP